LSILNTNFKDEENWIIILKTHRRDFLALGPTGKTILG
jgi:hypothetical protein